MRAAATRLMRIFFMAVETVERTIRFPADASTSRAGDR
jgi:hypothetical protein